MPNCFFEDDADHNLICEGETLYGYITYKVYNEITRPDWEYILSFYKLLVIYGGGGKDYPKPVFKKEIELNQIDAYWINLEMADDNYHIHGYLMGAEGNVVADL